MDNSKTKEFPTPYDVENKAESYHWWFVVRRKLLKSILSSIQIPANSLTLDIGCGTGSILRVLASAGLYAFVIDRSIYVLSLVRRKEKFLLLAVDLNQLPIKTRSAGLIIAADIHEHLRMTKMVSANSIGY